jgi:hypothetical protein
MPMERDPMSAGPQVTTPSVTSPSVVPPRATPSRAEAVGRRPAPGAPVDLVVDIPRVRRVMWRATAVLVILNIAASIGASLDAVPYTLTRFFDGDNKVNFPTGAKTLYLLACTVLLLGSHVAARRRNDPSATGWLLLGLCTAFAFVDETTYLHQSLSEVMTGHFHFTGVLTYAWTIVYWPVAAMASVFLVRNLGDLHPRVRRLLLPGGVLYVTGAIVMEPLKSELADRYGEGSLPMELTAAVSDSMQLIGLTLLASALIAVLAMLTPSITLHFSRERRAAR